MKHLSNNDFNDNLLTNVPDGVSPQDAVNKGQLDTSLSGKVSTGALVYNVKDYGATGDGTTDDTSAIQDALDEALAAGGGIVYFPAGTYSVFPVYAGAGVSIQGAGNLVTVVKRRNQVANNTDSVGAINFHGTSVDELQRFFVRDITADGNRGGITAGTGGLIDNEAFSFIYCRNFTVDSCRGINAPGEGFDMDYCFNGTFTGNVAQENGGNGFHASLESKRLKFIGNYAWNNGIVYNRSGFDQWTSATDCIYIGNVSENNVYRNYSIEGSGAIFVGNKSYGNPSQPDVFSGVAGSGLMATTRTSGVIRKDNVIIMSGWSYATGNGNQRLEHTLVIPEDVDEILSLNVSYLAGRSAASGTPNTIEDFTDGVTINYGVIGVSNIDRVNKTATVRMERPVGQSWSSSYYYGYSWIAIGKKMH